MQCGLGCQLRYLEEKDMMGLDERRLEELNNGEYSGVLKAICLVQILLECAHDGVNHG